MVIKYNQSKTEPKCEDQKTRRKGAVLNIAIVLIVFLFATSVALTVILGFQIKFCGLGRKGLNERRITKELFGNYEGRNVYRYTMKNQNAMEVKILDYGGIITNVYLPDKNHNREDIVLGFDTFEGYKNNTPYFGSLIGRYANRIAGGHFKLDGVTFNLTKNDGPNALHGGLKGFDKRLWNATIVGPRLVLFYSSADGEEHYPGQVNVTVTYELTERNELIITYRARTSKPTVISLTNHAYFNLAGQAAGTLSDHVIRLEADYYLPVDITEIPIGILSDVKGTKFDLRNDTNLGERIPEVPGNIGFDHNFCLQKPGWMKHAARVVNPTSGRTLDLYTTEPGVQLYTAYHLEGQPGKGGILYKKYGAFALEAQHYPDSPNEPTFPSTVLRPGQVYSQDTIYQFSITS